MTEELAAYARLELLHDVETRIEADLLTPFVDSLPKVSICSRVVEIRNPGRDRISQQFRGVEVVPAVIVASDEFPADRVPGPLQETTLSFGEITGILM